MGVPIRNEKMRVAGNWSAATAASTSAIPITARSSARAPRRASSRFAQAFARSPDYKPTLSRADRCDILRTTAEILDAAPEQIAELITAESGFSLKDTLYEVGRAYDVFIWPRSSSSG